jgi:hypothetical protein
MLDYLPFLAAAFGIPQYLPQIVKLRSTGDTAGVSWAWAALTGVNNTAWFGYFMLSGYWTAGLPSAAASLLGATMSVLLARRGARTRRATVWICLWTAALLVAVGAGGRTGLGTLLAAASIVQVTPSIWTAYRTARPTGISRGTWALVAGELSCWLAFGLGKSDGRLIVLGVTGVTAAGLMLIRATRTSRRRARPPAGAGLGPLGRVPARPWRASRRRVTDAGVADGETQDAGHGVRVGTV